MMKAKVVSRFMNQNPSITPNSVISSSTNILLPSGLNSYMPISGHVGVSAPCIAIWIGIIDKEYIDFTLGIDAVIISIRSI
jgi:hypothetical protein